MSQDLLAAFGDDFPSHAQPSPSVPPAVSTSSYPSFDGWDSAPSYQNTSIQSLQQPQHFIQPASEDVDDDWGDFEGSTEVTAAPPKTAPIAAAVPVATQFSRWIDEEDDGFKDYSRSSNKPNAAKWDFTKPDPPPKARDPNVLFDAEDEPPLGEDEDDFGDFEEAERSAPIPLANISAKPATFQPMKPPSSAMGDLLGMDDFSTPAPMMSHVTNTQPTRHVKTNSLLDLGDLTLESESTNAWRIDEPKTPIHSFGTLGALSKPRSKSPTKANHTDLRRDMEILDMKPSKQPPASRQRNVLRKPQPPKPVAMEEEEKWDDFDAWEQNGPAQASPMPASSPAPPSRHSPVAIPAALTSPTSDSSISSPPTNIPPPALVLSLFAPLFASAEASFFKPLRQENAEVQQAIYSEAAATTYLKGMLALATVCGRVIAGRKNRWKRDTILAQSMRIGAAGGVSGLKLTSIDKAEVAKEDREAADAVKAWSLQVGKLKGAVAEVKRLTGKDICKIPELKETLPVKVAKEIEGGLKGNRQCALCGLKREERVLKVDFEVEDSFGEWWIDNASMHRDCRNFWEQHRDTLRSR